MDQYLCRKIMGVDFECTIKNKTHLFFHFKNDYELKNWRNSQMCSLKLKIYTSTFQKFCLSISKTSEITPKKILLFLEMQVTRKIFTRTKFIFLVNFPVIFSFLLQFLLLFLYSVFFFLLVCLFFAFFLLVCLFFAFFCLFVCFLLFFACLFVFCFFFCLFVCFLKLKIYILIHIPLCGRVSDHKIFTQPISGIVYFF